MTTHQDMLFHLGGVPVMAGLPFGRNSKYFFVDPANGSDGNDGLSPNKALATIPAAFNKCTANQHDTVLYMAGSSGTNLTAALDWNKNYTHLIGVGAKTKYGSRNRIFQLSTLTGASPLLTISATGCIFDNIYIFQGVNDATSLVNVLVTGRGNQFSNFHFAGGGHATQAINGGASLLLTGAEENTFTRCTIGVDTIAAATGMAGLVVSATGGAPRNTFDDCRFNMKAGAAGAIFVELLGNSGLDRVLEFNKCRFVNLAAQAMTQAFAVDSGFDPNDKRILTYECTFVGAPKWDDGDTGMVFGNMNAVTGADGSGGLVELIT